MTTKNTILTEQDSKLIEQALLKYGRIVSVKDLMQIFKQEYSAASAHNRIQFLAKAGWFLRIKRGLYLIIDNITSRSINDLSLIQISNILQKDSYVSFALALNYYQMFDQYSKTVTAVTFKASKKYMFADHIFKFAKVNKKMYFGFSKKMEGGKIIRIADAEKALIDFIYFDKSFYSASLVFEKIKEHQHDLDFNKLQNYSLRYGVAMQRKIGFLLNQVGVNAEKLYQTAKNKKGYTRFTKDSKIFNSKWRLYYDDRIIR